MILYTYIGTVAISSLLSFISYKKRNSEMDGVELLIYNIFSFIPVLNLLIVGNFSYKTIKNRKNKKLQLEQKEKEINKLYQCLSCKIYTRKAYIEDSVCPVCKEFANLKYVNNQDSIELSKKIPEQQYLTLREYELYKNRLEQEKRKRQLELKESEYKKLEEEKKEPIYLKQEELYEEIKKNKLGK